MSFCEMATFESWDSKIEEELEELDDKRGK